MPKKAFVSLSFTPRKLQVLKLNPTKDFVEKFTTIDLPEGLISNYVVKDKNALAEILKSAWQQLGLKEKSVGLVIPEFSTFTKSLVLPKLEIQELDEAVRWQFQDLLPSIDGKMVMDWKIVNHKKNDQQILAVAIPKTLLLNYIDAVSAAGLFPLVVETPSLSLVRISNHEPSAKLIVYVNFGEAVLSLAYGQKILSSSVVSSADPNGILWTARNMVGHYGDTKIERIEIGGLELTQEIIDRLQESLGKPIHQIEVKLGGLSIDQVQEYLVPLSLQFKDPAEPRDEKTINLLPPTWVKRYQNKKTKRQLWILMIITSIFIGICFLGILGTNFWLNTQTKRFQKLVDQAIALPKEISNQIDEINQAVDKILRIDRESHSPQGVINAIAQARPLGVNLSEYKIDLDTGRIFLKGSASSRQALIQFKKNLESNKDFSKVKIPISSFEAEQNLEFEVSLIYKKES